MSDTPPIVLVFAATDPSGGGGMPSDILTLASMGCHALTVVTAITVQDTMGIEAVMPIEADWVADQARCVLEDMPVAAFKLGVLGSAENATVIAALLSEYPPRPLVFDPVLASGRGDTLASSATVEVLLDSVLPLTTVLTPNSVEARRLAGAAPGADLAECAARLIARGAAYVLITGTHEADADVVNTLYGPDGARHAHTWKRLAGSYHGSGCTLASAIAAQLALGQPVADAVLAAQDYTWRALQAGFQPADGQFLPCRFHAAHSREAVP